MQIPLPTVEEQLTNVRESISQKNNPIIFVFAGGIRHGKSSLIKALCTTLKATVVGKLDPGKGVFGRTKVSCAAHFKLNRRDVILIDMPGVDDRDVTPTVSFKHLEYITQDTKGVHGIFLCNNAANPCVSMVLQAVGKLASLAVEHRKNIMYLCFTHSDIADEEQMREREEVAKAMREMEIEVKSYVTVASPDGKEDIDEIIALMEHIIQTEPEPEKVHAPCTDDVADIMGKAMGVDVAEKLAELKRKEEEIKRKVEQQLKLSNDILKKKEQNETLRRVAYQHKYKSEHFFMVEGTVTGTTIFKGKGPIKQTKSIQSSIDWGKLRQTLESTLYNRDIHVGGMDGFRFKGTTLIIEQNDSYSNAVKKCTNDISQGNKTSSLTKDIELKEGKSGHFVQVKLKSFDGLIDFKLPFLVNIGEQNELNEPFFLILEYEPKRSGEICSLRNRKVQVTQLCARAQSAGLDGCRKMDTKRDSWTAPNKYVIDHKNVSKVFLSRFGTTLDENWEFHDWIDIPGQGKYPRRISLMATCKSEKGIFKAGGRNRVDFHIPYLQYQY